MKPKCELCGSRHELYQGHVFKAPATNTTATNGKRLTVNGHATNKVEEEHQSPSPARQVVEAKEDSVPGVVRTKNRRNREAYNAYQREYMKGYRKKRGTRQI